MANKIPSDTQWKNLGSRIKTAETNISNKVNGKFTVIAAGHIKSSSLGTDESQDININIPTQKDTNYFCIVQLATSSSGWPYVSWTVREKHTTYVQVREYNLGAFTPVPEYDYIVFRAT